VSEDDAIVFLSCERFAALRAARAKEQVQTPDPLEIIEDFAHHTAVVFTYEFSPVSKAISQAINEVHHGRGAT